MFCMYIMCIYKKLAIYFLYLEIKPAWFANEILKKEKNE